MHAIGISGANAQICALQVIISFQYIQAAVAQETKSTVTYGYNSAGQLSSIVTPSGQLIGYAYSNNRISEITVNGTPQLSTHADKRFSWPVYVTTLRARLRCPVFLLVVATDKNVAGWAAEPRGSPGTLRRSRDASTEETLTAVSPSSGYRPDMIVPAALRLSHSVKESLPTTMGQIILTAGGPPGAGSNRRRQCMLVLEVCSEQDCSCVKPRDGRI
jgi:YD repeat-containing protein